MTDFDRRQFLRGVLGKLTLAAGTVVLGRTSVSLAGSPGTQPEGADTPPKDIQKRADELAVSGTGAVEEAAAEPNEFLNLSARRPARPRLRPGVWGNIGWPNAGWPNGGWHNGVWNNGGWPNVGWNNGIWANGGWPNVGWRNAWF